MEVKCIIIDDEKPARKILNHYVDQIPFLVSVGDFKGPMSALETMNRESVDLIFIDIQMPQMSGLDFIRSLDRKPAIILTTAYREFALEGFELEVDDYLLKPISMQRFLRSVNKVCDGLHQPKDSASPKDDGFLILKSDKRIFRVPYHEVLLVQGSREYVTYQTQTMGKIMVYDSMKRLEMELPANHFLRVHRSYFVNSAHLRMLKGNSILVGEYEVPVSATYKEQILGYFSN